MQTSIGVILIVVSCYMIGEIYKVIVKKEKYKKLIPIVLAITGAIMGGLIYKSDKSLLMNVTDPLTAILIGIISGTSSTGTNQIVKQLFNKEEVKNEPEY